MTTEAHGDDELVDALTETSFVIMAMLSTIGAEHDLSLTQFRVLAILRDRRLRMSDLAQYLGLERSTMSGLVERAERRGLMARAPGRPDRRSVEVFLTPLGREFADRLTTQVGEAMADRLGLLNPTERRELAADLRTLLR